MTTRTIAAATGAAAQASTYRQAELALWRHYGLQPTERFIELGFPAARLRVLEVGAGEPVLFVHGTAGGAAVWAPLVRELPGCRCLLLERPGWGLSSPLDYSGHEYAAVVAQVLRGALDALDLGEVHIAAASIANVWALRLAQVHPSRVRRIVLIGGGPVLSDVPVPPVIRLLASPLGALMVRASGREEVTRKQLRGLGHGPSLEDGRIPPEYVAWRATLSRETPSMRNERDMVRAVVSWRTGFRAGLTFEDAELARIRQPTLQVVGTADPVGSVELCRRLAALLPGGELQLVDGAGHVPWLDDPGEVAARVDRFLAA